MTNKKTLILGLGNNILTDDGIGSQLVHDLELMIGDTDINYNSASCGGLEIIEYIKGYELVVFIDAIRTLKGKPGDVYYFIPSDFRETSHLSSLHDVSFLTALKLGDSLKLDLPTDLHIIGIEIIEDMEFSEDFTPPLKERYPGILQEVFELVKQIMSRERRA
jgi:hydrogenase maturation protease